MQLGEAVLKFPSKTYLFTGTAIEFNNVKAWKMAEVGVKTKFRSR